MIKGAQKSMIVVKTSDSTVFEEAYFVLRRGVAKDGTDMVGEATRIIENSGGKRKEGSKIFVAVAVSVSCFVCGGAIGSALTALIGFLI